ncbi:hypothetical protein GCM10018781_23620 [Kitasatospora indigofera]|uniref:Uncharacterized protein n=1 Tax=Kitasatospora indigofera TaxID=67307 RepID=A0A919FM34_9ACTN|nr:hypothetical protein [Kitasatospora indigofera]GHH67796.1 hypothetical protein GCM10018781_23620 [Kitasatospora indigofera]
MSSDFGFWKRCIGDPEEVFDNLADGDTSDLVVSPDVLRFREELLTRWPDVDGVMEPSQFDLEEEPDDAAKYVLLTLSVRQLDYLPDILDMAKKNGLVGFSGVAGEPI